jgi:hypothetical protein
MAAKKAGTTGKVSGGRRGNTVTVPTQTVVAKDQAKVR